MSYPPAGAKAPAELGAPPVAEVLFIDRNAPNEAGGSLRSHSAFHSRILEADALWRALASAAVAASSATADLEARELAARCSLPPERQEKLNRKSRVVEDHDRAHAHLWDELDPSLGGKSAAVKCIAQAASLEQLCASGAKEKFGAVMQAWLSHARIVAHGMHQLFLAGVHDWDVGLDNTQTVLTGDMSRRPIFTRDAWMPFEDYDRTDDPRYANCFGESDAQRYRSRVSVDKSRLDAASKQKTKVAWDTALASHWKMLELEAKHALFVPGEAACRLSAAEIGGLFLLTNVPDNWAKRQDLFDASFWKLRAVHFGMERNCGLRINKFSLQPLRAHDYDDRIDCTVMRQSSPDPMRSYCWLDNALHTMVALKVLIFWRLRMHAYDRAEGLPFQPGTELATALRIDRHDIEQSKNHWLPATRESVNGMAIATMIQNVKHPVLRLAAIRPQGPHPKSKAQANAGASTSASDAKKQKTDATSAVVSVNAERQRKAGLVTVRLALASMAAERFKLRRRIDVLDRMVGLHAAYGRLCATETQRLEAQAVERIRELTEHRDTIGLDEDERLAAQAAIDAITSDFDMSKLQTIVSGRMRRVAATEGLLWECKDRIWKSDHASVVKLREVEPPTNDDEDVRVRIPYNEWEDCFGVAGTSGLYGLVSRCSLPDGWARREARSLADRLFGLIRQEAEYREVQSLDTLVAMPIECRAEVAIGPVDEPPTTLPDHLRVYAGLLRAENERKRAFGTFVSACRRTMARAIQRCFYSCLLDASADSDTIDDGVVMTDDDDEDAYHHGAPAGGPRALQMPTRLYGARRTIAVDIVHRFLNIAHAFGGLAIVDDATTPLEDETCILVYHRATGQLVMPCPEDIVEQHWEATQHMLDVAVRAEAWVRDHRRRIDGTLLLTRLQRWVTVAKETGPHVHGHVREQNVFHDLERNRQERTRTYWPSWPPREHMLCTHERIQTAFLWGRHAAFTALGESRRAEREHVPNEPYHNHGGLLGVTPIGEHVWLHEAHTHTMRAAAEDDDEIDEVDLFGGEDEDEDEDEDEESCETV